MQFLIHSDAFTREPGAGETVPLKTVKTGRMLFLKATAAALLDRLDAWTAFDAFSAGAGDAQKADWLDGLTLLECFDIAELTDLPLPARDPDGCRVAGERDYKAVGAFLQENVGKGFSAAAITDPRYYSEDNVRARQFLNQEYNFLREENGALQAVLTISVPRPENVSCVGTVDKVVFDAALDEPTAVRCLSSLISFAGEEFTGDLSKLRFFCTGGERGWLLERLVGLGFAPVCTLEREMHRSVDVTFYDRTIEG